MFNMEFCVNNFDLFQFVPVRFTIALSSPPKTVLSVPQPDCDTAAAGKLASVGLYLAAATAKGPG